MKRRALVLSVSVLALLLLGFVTYKVMDFSAGMCGKALIARESSANHQASVVVFEADCGATTDFSTAVALLYAGEHLGQRPARLLLVVDSDHGRAAQGPGGGPWVEAHWAGPDSIVIHYDAAARVFRQTTVFDGVRVVQIAVQRVGA